MNKLSRAQLDHIAHYVQQSNPQPALAAELLDHLASQIEQRMAQGHDFSTAFGQVVQQASPQAISQLKHVYSQELTGRPLPVARVGRRTKRRPTARPLQYMLLSSLFTCLMVVLCLLVAGRWYGVPGAAFGLVWKVALLALLSVVVVRGWLARRRRKPRLARIA